MLGIMAFMDQKVSDSVIFKAGFAGYNTPRAVFSFLVRQPLKLCIMAGMVQKDSCSGMARLVLLVTVHLVLCFLLCLQARDARHHGRYGPEGFVRLVQGLFLWVLTMHLALCSLVCRLMMLDIMAVMDQKDTHVWCPWSDCKLWSLRSCSPSLVVDISFAVQRQSYGPDSSSDLRFSPDAVQGGRRPCLQVVQISLSWRRGLSHGPDWSSDHGVSTVCLRQGDRRPFCAGRERSTCAVVEKTVVLPRLHCHGFRLEEQLINALMS